jgi:hypothetical protein
VCEVHQTEFYLGLSFSTNGTLGPSERPITLFSVIKVLVDNDQDKARNKYVNVADDIGVEQMSLIIAPQLLVVNVIR